MCISYQSLNRNMKTLKLSKMEEIAGILNCEVTALIEFRPNYAHFYDPDTKEWLGIRK